jgi:ABC-2 type transport system permease protein
MAEPGAKSGGRARAYGAIVALRCRMLLQYRAAALAGFATQLFWGFIKVMVFVAFYASATSAPPMTLSEVLVYVWLGQALLALLPWNVDAEIAEQIRSGGVAYELLRPLDLYGFWFARTLAFRVAPTLLRMLPMLLVTLGLMPLVGLGDWALPWPDSTWSGLLFVAAVVGTIALSTAFTMILHITLMWTVSGEGINRMMPGVVPVLAGLIVPLPLFPDWMQGLLYWQPFRGMADVPFRIYSGHIPVGEAWLELAVQWLWTAALIGFGLWLLTRARTRLVVQGG